MSRTILILIAGMLGAAFVASPASAQDKDPFAKSDCREARLDQVISGRTVSSQPVIICKPTQKVKALVSRVQRGPVIVSTDAGADLRIAFNAPRASDVECARLDCPTFVLSGVGF